MKGLCFLRGTKGKKDRSSIERKKLNKDFSLIGILADITTILKRDKIPVFVVSTYNTDYVLLKKTLLSKATATLEKSGYRFVD